MGAQASIPQGIIFFWVLLVQHIPETMGNPAADAMHSTAPATGSQAAAFKPVQPTADAMHSAVPLAVPQDAAVKPGRPRCQYGEKCFRQNPQHKADFSHPGDDDWSAT